jgi:hypothetical protein
VNGLQIPITDIDPLGNFSVTIPPNTLLPGANLITVSATATVDEATVAGADSVTVLVPGALAGEFDDDFDDDEDEIELAGVLPVTGAKGPQHLAATAGGMLLFGWGSVAIARRRRKHLR